MRNIEEIVDDDKRRQQWQWQRSNDHCVFESFLISYSAIHSNSHPYLIRIKSMPNRSTWFCFNRKTIELYLNIAIGCRIQPWPVVIWNWHSPKLSNVLDDGRQWRCCRCRYGYRRPRHENNNHQHHTKFVWKRSSLNDINFSRLKWCGALWVQFFRYHKVYQSSSKCHGR